MMILPLKMMILPWKWWFMWQTEARELAKTVSTRRAAAISRIWTIFRPLAKRWCAGTLILMVTEGMWGVIYGHLMSICNLGFNLRSETLAEAARYAASIAVGLLVSENDGFCIENEKFCIQNDELCIARYSSPSITWAIRWSIPWKRRCSLGCDRLSWDPYCDRTGNSS